MAENLDQTIVQYLESIPFYDIDMDPVFEQNPGLAYQEMTKIAPVVSSRNSMVSRHKIPDFADLGGNDQELFFTMTYEAWREVVSKHNAFSSEKSFKVSAKTFGPKLLVMLDEPEHAQYKKLVLPAFSHRIVTTEITKVAEPIIDQLLDNIVQNGRGDLIGQFTAKYPALIICQIFGVPVELTETAIELTSAGLTAQVAADPATVLKRLDAFYQAIVDRHRKVPSDDLTSMLIATETDGRPLTDEEVISFMKVIIGAGLDTTVRQTANLIYLLLENPEQFEDLLANPDLLESAIWEASRLIPATSTTPRVAVCDTEVCGVSIPAGSGIYPVIAAANVDASRWENPLKFDIRREKKQIATFGGGVHACLGANLSLAEMKIAMTGVLSRLKNLRKDPQRWSGVQMRGYKLRAPNILPVLWDVD